MQPFTVRKLESLVIHGYSPYSTVHRVQVGYFVNGITVKQKLKEDNSQLLLLFLRQPCLVLCNIQCFQDLSRLVF